MQPAVLWQPFLVWID